MASNFLEGDLVWAKIKGYPPWPAVAYPTDGKSPKSKKQQHFVYFLGTHDCAWIPDNCISPHSEEMLAKAKSRKRKSSSMRTGIQEMESASQNPGEKYKLILDEGIENEPVSSPQTLPTPKKIGKNVIVKQETFKEILPRRSSGYL